MKLKYPHLPKTLGTIIQENYWSFYPSGQFIILHFNVRYPVLHNSPVSNIESDNSQNFGLEDYNNISVGIFPYFPTPQSSPHALLSLLLTTPKPFFDSSAIVTF